jgi:hypothetical protein
MRPEGARRVGQPVQGSGPPGEAEKAAKVKGLAFLATTSAIGLAELPERDDTGNDGHDAEKPTTFDVKPEQPEHVATKHCQAHAHGPHD